MIGQAYDDNGTMRIRNLAGAASGGLPLGTIIAMYDNVVPYGYLPCNGTQYDITQYPRLYLLLSSQYLPDLRECTLVGIGQNSTHTIAAHDVYTLGQFKDDQLQQITSSVLTNGKGGNVAGVLYSETSGGTSVYPYRAGATTHGKQIGVNYCIKALTGTSVVDPDPDVYSQIVAYLTANYTKTSGTLADMNLVCFSEMDEGFMPITNPSASGQLLSWNGTDYEWFTLPNTGSGTNPIYIDNGAFEASTDTVGSGTNPIYLDNGEITASSDTVGSVDIPVYLDNGTLTETVPRAPWYEGTHTVTGMTVGLTSIGHDDGTHHFPGKYAVRMANISTGTWTLSNTSAHTVLYRIWSNSFDSGVLIGTLTDQATMTFGITSDNPYIDKNSFTVEFEEVKA